MSSSPLSNFMLSLPVNLALVSDNAKSASQPAAPHAGKPVNKATSRWSETNASVSSPKAPSRPRACDSVLDEPNTLDGDSASVSTTVDAYTNAALFETILQIRGDETVLALLLP
jgi:hypothetical protein